MEMQSKFQLGQFIKHVGDPDGDFGPIINININESGVTYTITLKDFDREKRELIDAVKHIKEEDAIEKPLSTDNPLGPQEPQAPVEPTHSVTINETIQSKAPEGENNEQTS